MVVKILPNRNIGDFNDGAKADPLVQGGHDMIFEDFSGKLSLALYGPNKTDGDDFEHLSLFNIVILNVPSSYLFGIFLRAILRFFSLISKNPKMLVI